MKEQIDYSLFRCTQCYGSLSLITDLKLLKCSRCQQPIPISEEGIPIFSRSSFGIEEIQKDYSSNEIDIDYDQRFDGYLCRNQYLDKIFPSPGLLLDLAGGDGCIAYHFMKQGYQVALLDISEKSLRNALNHGLCSVGIVDVEKTLPFESESFDYVFWGDNVEHLLRPLNTLKEIARIMKPGGVLACSFPNMSYWVYRLKYLLYGNVPNTEPLNPEIWERDHIRTWNKNDFSRFISQTDFRVQSFLPVNKPGGRSATLNKLMSKLSIDLFAYDLLAIVVKLK
ncbi:MAG: class I SAM-dependent methyltransferase [Microcystis aeruginosa G11-01]|nr:class I SAM-dependent methyltransferase [Microcystis aeruginosa G13-10]NCS33994.1 class I SAM-dependent methyltransferase [Microcystis aeruginosa G11-01]